MTTADDSSTRDREEDAWLILSERKGVSTADIAEAFGVSRRTVQAGLRRAKERSRIREMLIPMFPIPAFSAAMVPHVDCRHEGGVIELGSGWICMVCHESGQDLRPEMLIRPGDIPAPEPRPSILEPTRALPTRREKRAAKLDPRSKKHGT